MTIQSLTTKSVAELRQQASTVGITGLRRQALSKDGLVNLLVMSHETGKKGDELYHTWISREREAGRTPAVNTAAEEVKAAEGGDLAAMIAAAIAPFVKTEGVDEAAVNELIDAKLTGIDEKIRAALKVKPIEVKRLVGTKVDVGIQHKAFAELLQLAACRIHTMLVGPAGSGKTSACHAVASGLGLEFYCFSVGMQTTKSDLLGYMDAHGKFVESIVYRAYKTGGVLLLDETDAGNANVLTILNAMLANGSMRFPNGELVERHADFVFFGAANTYGRGADRMYVGRNQLDAATLDRFAVVDFDYDEDLERAIAGNDGWTAKVQAWRWRAADLKERVVISPRASISGAKLLANGFTEKRVADLLVWKGIPTDIRRKIEG